MKKLFLFVFAIVTLIACSSSKDVANQSVDLKETASVKSYGTHGRIIYPDDVDQTQPTSKTEETEMQLSGDAAVLYLEPSFTSDEASIDAAAERDKKVAERVEQNKNANQTINTSAKNDWEPYRDPNRVRTGDKKKNGFAIAGFVLSLFVYFFPLAIVFSALGLKSEKRGLAIAGLVISSLWAALVIIAVIYSLAFL